jgi:glycolate oxidase iron-sulfur subunit
MADRAFDPHRPPEQALVDACVHCGFCLPTCPTYALWGEEMDSPRGRIVLMDQGLQAGSEMGDTMVLHLDRCLGCMACVTACPSGVRYDKLIEAARPQVERNAARPARERALRRALLALFTHPGRLRAAVPLLMGSRRLGLGRMARGAGLLRRSKALAAMERLAPDVHLSAAVATLPPFTPARGPRRGTVGLLQGCIQRVFFGQVNRATVRVLAAEGYDVVAPRLPGCCGALPLHAGDEPRAAGQAKETIRAFDGCDVVAVNAAGCGSAMKGYGNLLSDDPVWAERAGAFSSRVRDVSEILAGIEPVARRGPVRLTVAYHDACHLAHAQGIREEPRVLLRSIPGIELVEPAEWELCCGSAGLYNLLQPEAAAELGRRKARNLLATGAKAIAAGNPGCAMQIAAHLAEAGTPLPVYHPIELVAASIGAG